ncbi:MAG: hypothetical protein RR911_03705 [Oscillospiraceae bacterium]
MAKSNKKSKSENGIKAKLLIPFSAAGIAAVAALVVIINPFNILKILKNNYPNLAK